MEETPFSGKKIVFFDGDCMLCNSLVAFLVKQRVDSLFFCNINSSSARAILASYSYDGLPQNTIYFLSDDKLYVKSTAVLKVLNLISTISKITSHCLLLVPVFLRDAVYTLVAKNRYRFFKKTSCYIPTAEEKVSFL